MDSPGSFGQSRILRTVQDPLDSPGSFGGPGFQTVQDPSDSMGSFRRRSVNRSEWTNHCLDLYIHTYVYLIFISD